MRNGPNVHPPVVSFRFIVMVTFGFVSFVGILIILSFFGADKTDALSLNAKVRYDSPEDIPDSILKTLDATVVLGGGLPTSVDEPPIFVQRRCDDAAQVAQRYQNLPSKLKREQRLPILSLSAGTAHLPQLLSANDGLPVWESTASAAYLLKHHASVIDKSQLYVETTSYDTIGNAFYTRTSFTDINGWRNLLVVTNEFHMDRTQAIFDWIFGLDDNYAYHLFYLSPPNTGLTEEAVRARKEREAASQNTVETILAPKYKSMKAVWYFLTREHALYTAHKLVDRGHGDSGKQVDESIKLSYGGSSNKQLNKPQEEVPTTTRGTDSL